MDPEGASNMMRFARLLSVRLALTAVAIALVSSPAVACEQNGNLLEWKTCWSLYRIGLWLLLLLPAFGLSYLMFQHWLKPTRRNPLWPKTALGRTLALIWLFAGLAFLIVFALVSKELMSTTGSGPFGGSGLGVAVNSHWPWMLVAVVTFGGAAIIHWAVRHDEKTT